MMLKRVAGRTAHLSSGGGGISIDVLQVATGVVDSEGGDITIGQVRLPRVVHVAWST